jgi:hypothetical protein
MPATASGELQELIQQADAFEARGAFADATRLGQILAIVERALEPEHPNTAESLNNLAGLQLAQTNAPAAEPLLQRLTLAQADWLRRELPLLPRDLRHDEILLHVHLHSRADEQMAQPLPVAQKLSGNRGQDLLDAHHPRSSCLVRRTIHVSADGCKSAQTTGWRRTAWTAGPAADTACVHHSG